MKRKLFNLCMTALLSVVSTTAWALSEVGGVYQIGSAADLKAFAELVNGGNVYANAILTADIELGDITTKISNDANKYQGLFDGAGHTITINLADRTDGEGPALFRNLGNRGIIQNLKVQGIITTGTYKHTAAIANYSVGLIRNCFVDITVNASFGDSDDASIGGIAGQLNRPAIIENCLAKVKILGTTTHKCGGVAAWVDEHHVTLANNLVLNDPESNFNYSDGKSAGLARVGDNPLKSVDLSTYNTNSYTNRPTAANANNYVTNNWGVTNDGTTVVTPAEVASGKVCFQLNSDQSHIGWVQNEGDAFPVPAVFGAGKGQMYASAATNCQGKAEGEVTFGNTPSNAVVTKHTYDKYGVCTTCGQFNFNCFEFDDLTRFEPVTKSVLISSGDDLYLAEGWNRLQNGFKLNIKLANDVTCTPPNGQLIFNSADWMDCSFDGDGHTLTIEMANINESNASFLPQFSGNFENVIMHGSIGTSKNHGASISGYFRGSGQKIRNVFSDITINTTCTGDNTCGGLAGIDGGNVTFENCIYAGDIIGVSGTTCLGGFAGWANGATSYNNCAFLGTMTNAGGDSHTISRNVGNVTSTNVFSLNEYNGTDAGKYVKTTAAAVASGELAFKLNGEQGGVERFYQKLGTGGDPMPMPIAKDGALVYAISSEYRCDGLPIGAEITYGNSPSGTIPAHTYVDGWCTVCSGMQDGYMTPVNGYFEIGTRGQLAWWAKYACTHPDANARLTADIDMKVDDTNNYSKYYVPAGTATSLYKGEFDGQGHTISNLILSTTNNYTGLFGVIGGGANIKNFVLDNTCSITGASYVGIIGGTNGSGKVYVTNVGNEGPVTGSGANVSGIIGVDMGGAADMFITNCFVAGAIKGARESATICSWSSGGSIVENCYSIATLEGKYGDEDSFTRGSASCVNCYEIEGVGTQNNKTGANRTNLISATDVANGVLCYKLNGEQSGLDRFYQKLGTGGDAHPTTIAKAGALLYLAPDGGYRCDGAPLGNVTYTNTAPAATLPDHQFNADGICTVCHELEKDADGYMKISNATQLVAFTAIVNTDGKTATKARMYADVDMAGITDYYPIGCEEYVYAGEFDGQGHVVKNLVIDNGGYNYQGMFGRIGNHADIKNFILDKTCSIKGQAFVGVIGGTNGAGDVYITNIGNEGTIASNAQNAAGILGVDWNGSMNLHITNCYVTGAVNGDHESATICAWSSNNSLVKNCWSTATLTGMYSTGSFTRGNTAIENCYEIDEVGQQDGVNKVTAAQVTNGALCFKAGDGFTQTIGTDAHPVLFGLGQAVKQVSTTSFTNLPVADGKVQIATGAELKKFAAEVNAGNTTSDALLTADIDMSSIAWAPIGNETYQYAGTFDGAGKAITNFSYTATADYNGLFGFINGATVKDFSIAGELTSNYKENGVVGWTDGAAVVSGIHSSLNITVDCGTHTGGVVGGSKAVNEAPLLVENCTFDGTLTSNNNADAQGGIIGYTYVGTVRNCLFNGTINGNVADKHYGGILGYSRIDNFGGIHNCLSIGKIVTVSPANAAAIIGNWNGPATTNVTNNYYLLADGSTTDIAIGNKADMISEAPVLVTAAQLASGEVAYKLGEAFRQVLDTDATPNLDSSKPSVYQIAVTDAGYATFVPKANVAALPAGVTAYAAQKNPTYIHLEEVTEVPADNAVVVKAAEGEYYYNSTTETRTLGVANDLTFSNNDVATDGTQYILANNSGVGFYKATGTIPAGKGYLVINGGALAKAFYPFEDDDPTGIENLNINDNSNDVIYNIAGQRINKAQNGINIINGKKILK